MNPVTAGRTDMAIQIADEAEREISRSMAAISKSEAPSMDRAAGEIDLAYKLKLIDYERRDVLLGQLREIVNHRRACLLKQRQHRLMRAQA